MHCIVCGRITWVAVSTVAATVDSEKVLGQTSKWKAGKTIVVAKIVAVHVFADVGVKQK